MPKLSDKEMGRRRGALIDAARACFARRGFEETSMDEVCAEAGISKGALYGHFKSKDELIWAVADAQASWIEEVGRIESREELVRRLIALIAREEGGERAARLEVFAVARCFSDPGLRARYLANHQLLVEALAQVMTRLGAPSPSAAARMLDTFLMGKALLGALLPEEDRARDVEAMLTLLLPGATGAPPVRARD